MAAALALSVYGGSTLAQGVDATKPVPCAVADRSAGKCPVAAGPAQKFPFPGDAPGTSTAADPDDPITPGASAASSSSDAPDANSPDAPATTGRKQFPYPGEPAPAQGGSQGGSSSSSSASSSSSSSSAADPDDPLDPPATASSLTPGRRKLPKVKKLQSDEDREVEDVKVARFYRDDGNSLAAYNRLRDATKLATDDADAWYLLGDVAEKLHKTEEASDAYRKFLALEPNTGRAKKLAREQPQLNAKR